jgi:hypothetical protein
MKTESTNRNVVPKQIKNQGKKAQIDIHSAFLKT